MYRILICSFVIICISESLTAQSKKIEPVDSANGFDQDIRAYSEEDNIFSSLVKMILVHTDEQHSAGDYSRLHKSLIDRSAGKTIRKITIVVLDVFGASVSDPNDTVRSWLQVQGNALHLNSRDWLIENKLIFSENEKLIPFNVQESERIIRESPYVYDARIIPQRIRNNPDSVDLIVYVQDIWSMNAGVSYSPGRKAGSTSFNDINLLGFGNEFRGKFKFDPRLPRGWDWDASYTIDNIEKSFISAKVYFSSELYSQLYGVSVTRDFLTPIIRWGGGIGQYWQNIRYPDLMNISGYSETVRYNQQDYWLGHAFDLEPFDPATVYQNRFNIAGRITRTVYSEKPDSTKMDLFQDNTFYLGRFGFFYRQYYQDHYIFGLGRTEDIPLINMIALFFGVEQGTHSTRPYYGLKTAYSFCDAVLGYVYGGFQIGAFQSDQKWSDRTSKLELLYFSHLHYVGSWMWRHYIGSRYTYSYNPRMPLDVLTLNNDGGLRGFSDEHLKGTKKIVLNYEADIFAPVKLLGFKLAVITFADFGLISSSNCSLSTSKLYQGYGFGFRFKNEHLIFPTFQFMLGFYPNIPEAGGRHFSLFHQGSMFYEFNQNQFSAPSIVSVN